jgi:hypothetical protein
LRGDLKGESVSEVTATQDQALKENIMQQKYYKQKQRAIACCVNKLIRQ